MKWPLIKILNPAIAEQAAILLNAAATALGSDPDAALVAPLAGAVDGRNCPAQALRAAVERGNGAKRLIPLPLGRILAKPRRPVNPGKELL
ncbi:hypothetical protein HC891_19410 [Candidatus Gracilibacteria bacterium]|nr:hypothetical protein [Candidatus Gracilibacteria bacterium]